jgi:hypothetical protein
LIEYKVKMSGSNKEGKKGGRPPNSATHDIQQGMNPFAIAKAQSDAAAAAALAASSTQSLPSSSGGGSTKAAAPASTAPPLSSARAPTEPEVEGCRSQAQLRFMRSVKDRIDKQVRMTGHGNQTKKQEGQLRETSLWFHPPDPALQRTPPCPQQFYIQPCYLLCFEYVEPRIGFPPCPTCMSSEHVTRDGWDPSGRKVYGEHGIYYLIGFQYERQLCRKAGVKYSFAPWNPKVVQQLPREMQQLLPCLILSRSAIDIKFVQSIDPLVLGGIGVQGVEKIIEERYKEEYYRRYSMYYFGISRRRQFAEGQQILGPAQQFGDLNEPEPFSAFDDSSGYAGSVPSDNLLLTAWYQACELSEHYYHRHAQQVCGRVLAGDASFKFVSTTLRCSLLKITHA